MAATVKWSISADQRPRYEAWCKVAPPTAQEGQEALVVFLLADGLGLDPGLIMKAVRGSSGGAQARAEVEVAIESDPAIALYVDPPHRRVGFVEDIPVRTEYSLSLAGHRGRQIVRLSADPFHAMLPPRLPDKVSDRWPGLAERLSAVAYRDVRLIDWTHRGQMDRVSWQREWEALIDSVWDDLAPVASLAMETLGIYWCDEMLRLLDGDRTVVTEAVLHLLDEKGIAEHGWRSPLRRMAVYIESKVDSPPVAVACICTLCGRSFPPEFSSPVVAAMLGVPFCGGCADVIASTDRCLESPGGGPTTADEALRQVCALLGHPVGPTITRDIPYASIEPRKRVDLAAAAAFCASVEYYRTRHGPLWPEVLLNLGIIQGPLRLGRGTICVANDGHRCRSLSELMVDDFLASRKIKHEPEPLWPPHPTLNPTGRKRADWLVAGEVTVEFAGMMDDPGYAQRMAVKQTLAEALGITLVVVYPADLTRLDDVFARWIA